MATDVKKAKAETEVTEVINSIKPLSIDGRELIVINNKLFLNMWELPQVFNVTLASDAALLLAEAKEVTFLESYHNIGDSYTKNDGSTDTYTTEGYRRVFTKFDDEFNAFVEEIEKKRTQVLLDRMINA